MDKNNINVGDEVAVHFEHVTSEYSLEVLSLPYETGQPWRLKRRNGDVIYIQSFSKMIRLSD